ncbi:MAG TPA: DUF3631 domain-containing protein [Micromonosporaceae bacterium]|nr:DUF3631 domain-containing protein [Micromonosporaceae bacterium]
MNEAIALALQYVADGWSQPDAAERTGVPLFELRAAIESYVPQVPQSRPSRPASMKFPADLRESPLKRDDGAVLLDELRAVLLKYVVLPNAETADAVVLWIAATHVQPAWEHAPRLVAVSPEKRCGKSRLMDIVEATVHRPIVTVNISPAALVRSITEKDPPTLCVDEADTIFGPKAADNHEDLRGLVNSGHQRGRPYLRYDITTRTVEELPTFAMAMLAGIGDLPDTIMDRAIVVRMRRRAPGEVVAPYRTRRDRPALHDIRDRWREWVRVPDRADELLDAEPTMPVEDRAADTWEPLVAIADAAGGSWPDRARSAALHLVALEDAADVEVSLGARLLADIRDTFADWTVSFLASTDLLSALRKIEDAPWRELDMTAHALAGRLRPYGIRPGRNATGTARGYRLDDFLEAFARYGVKDRQSVKTAGQATDDPKGSDGLNRQTQTTVSTVTRGSDPLTVSDGR